MGGAAEETPAALIPFNRKPQRTPDRETDTSPGILLSPGERLDTLRGTPVPGRSGILMPCATGQPWVPLNNSRGWPGKHTRQSTMPPLLTSCFGRSARRRGFTPVPPQRRSIRDSHRPDWADHCHEARAGSCGGPYLHRPGRSLLAYSSNSPADPEAPVSPVTSTSPKGRLTGTLPMPTYSAYTSPSGSSVRALSAGQLPVSPSGVLSFTLSPGVTERGLVPVPGRCRGKGGILVTTLPWQWSQSVSGSLSPREFSVPSEIAD